MTGEVGEMQVEETEETETAHSPPQPQPNDEVFNAQLLKMYYKRLFPYHFIHSWLCYDPSSTEGPDRKSSKVFSRREFSYTIMIDNEEIYIRYQSYSNVNDFCKAIEKRQPVKIDIGAVFSHPPKDHKTIQSEKFSPEQRELVFDIDLTDYDGIRKCGCDGAKICIKCWQMMTMAVKVMDQGLREDFGFEHMAWFYSGRRGVHCWVCDESARMLTNEARSAVASYFEINLGSDKNTNVKLPHPLHPMMKRSYSILEPMFVEHIIPSSGHAVLAQEDRWTELLETLPPAANAIRNNLGKKWPKSKSTPAERWSELKQHLQFFEKGGPGKAAKTMSSADRQALESWPYEAVFRYTYPRLDINVSKMRNHLLKSPFCVHPKTGRVCVPIRVQDVENFDPFAVPTLPQLMDELDEFEQQENKPTVTYEWQKTSLKGSFGPFQKEFLEPLLKHIRKQQRDAKEQQAAVVGDF